MAKKVYVEINVNSVSQYVYDQYMGICDVYREYSDHLPYFVRLYQVSWIESGDIAVEYEIRLDEDTPTYLYAISCRSDVMSRVGGFQTTFSEIY